MWNIQKVQDMVTDPNHPMYAFVQLCVEQEIVAPEDVGVDDMFMHMGCEAISRYRKHQLSYEVEIFHVKSRRVTRREDSLRPADAMSIEDIERLNANPRFDFAEKRLCCSIIDNIVRRQILHSYVSAIFTRPSMTYSWLL